MKSKYARFRMIIAFLMLFMMFILVAMQKVQRFGKEEWKDEILFSGDGTKELPFLINCAEDISLLGLYVSEGYSFENTYFLQTCDIDLKSESPWIPIGVFGSNRYFYGVYDGGAHSISNLYCCPDESGSIANNGLFGVLGGQVMNLGIESGSVEGAYIGSIASHSTGNSAAIINCYNKAEVKGSGRAGGICDNFSNGTIVNCVNLGEITAPVSAQIVSYNAKSVINVYPEKSAFTDFFQGTFFCGIEESEKEDLFAVLNTGIDYLKNLGLYDDINLRYWSENEE